MEENRQRNSEYLGGQHAVVPYHVRNILLKLGEQQQHHAYSDATASMETLAMAMDLVPDVLRDTGVKLLTSEPGSNKEALKMLKSMLAWQPKHGYRISAGEDAIASCGEGRYTLLRKNIAHQLQWYILVPVALVQTKEELILSTALYIGSRGNYLEAYDTLQSQVLAEPCKSNPYVHGYCGLFKYYLWKKGVGPVGVAVEESVDEEQSVVLAKQAVKHFTDMEALDVAPSSKGNVDVFITVHARLLHWLGARQDALTLLVSYRDSFPGRLSACRLVVNYLTEHGHEEEEVTSHLFHVVQLDDAGPEVLKLAEIYIKGGDVKGARELMEKYMAYNGNHSNKQASKIIKRVARSDQIPAVVC